MTDRVIARQALLQRAGWQDATVSFLAGDASDRTYDRLVRGSETAVLMDAPPGKGDDPAVFLAVAAHLTGIGLSAPRLLAQDLLHGFLLIEDFGDAVFARVLKAAPAREAELYATAIDALIQLQAAPPMAGLPALSAHEWAKAAALVFTEYANAADETAFVECLASLIDAVKPARPVMILRDFHAENLIWLSDRQGAAKAGLLDFQLAQMGHPVYDMISLLQDARRDVQPETASMMQRRFCEATGFSGADCDVACAVWGAQRALRILGVFARLARSAGKTSYLALIPRVWGHLQASLSHPALADLQRLCAPALPAPSPGLLARMGAYASA